MGLCQLFVCPSIRVSTLSNKSISETSGPITIKFYPKHHLGGGKAALGFGPDRIRTLVSMETDSSHRVIIGENVKATLAPHQIVWIFFILSCNQNNHKISYEFKIRPDLTKECGVSCFCIIDS